MSTDTVQVYQDANDEWRWRRRSANGKILADSGEGYVERRDCLRGVMLVNNLPFDLEIDGSEPTEIRYTESAAPSAGSSADGEFVYLRDTKPLEGTTRPHLRQPVQEQP
jgi:uncharacterized protein YegP (UPF0339 family)